MRYIIRFSAFVSICTLLAHCGYLGSDALSTLIGTPRFEYGIPFDVATLTLGLICFAIGWRQKHDFAFWSGAMLDLLISLLTIAYLCGWKDQIDARIANQMLVACAVAILTFVAGTHALFELGRTLIDFRRPIAISV